MKADFEAVAESAMRMAHQHGHLNQEDATDSQQRLAGYALDSEYRYFALALSNLADQLPHLRAILAEVLNQENFNDGISRAELVPLTLEMPTAKKKEQETDPDKLLEEFLKD